ncbi:DUF6161 domain-containing protein [Pseudomonas serbica]
MPEVHEVVLRLNGEKVKFESYEKLRLYLELQIAHWEWLTKLPGAYKDAGQAIFETYFSRPIQKIKQYTSKTVSPEFRLENEKMPFILYDSDEGFLIRRTKEEYDEVTAALALVYLNKHTRSAVHRDGQISSLTQSDRLAFEKSIAIQIAISLQGFSSIGSEARSSVMKETLDRFVSHAELATDAVNEYVTDIIDSTSSAKSDIDGLANSLTAAYLRRRRKYAAYMLKVRDSSRAAVMEAMHTLASAKAAYHDQVDLDASVQYWNARRRNHSMFKVVWFFAILLSMAVMFSSVLGYFGVGGAVGLSGLIHQLRTEEVISVNPPSMRLDSSPSSTQSTNFTAIPTKLAPIASESTATSLNSLSTIAVTGPIRSELTLVVADLAGAALLITLLGILIKITLRQFNTHSYLALEAEERITFTKTYLALLNEGKLKSEDDRKLVLESLFRSTKSGSIEEIPFSSPLELIFKTIADKKPG